MAARLSSGLLVLRSVQIIFAFSFWVAEQVVSQPENGKLPPEWQKHEKLLQRNFLLSLADVMPFRNLCPSPRISKGNQMGLCLWSKEFVDFKEIQDVQNLQKTVPCMHNTQVVQRKRLFATAIDGTQFSLAEASCWKNTISFRNSHFIDGQKLMLNERGTRIGEQMIEIITMISKCLGIWVGAFQCIYHRSNCVKSPSDKNQGTPLWSCLLKYFLGMFMNLKILYLNFWAWWRKPKSLERLYSSLTMPRM